MQNEIWRPIIGYENHYEVSNLGNIRRLGTNKNLKGSLSNKGYKCIKLSKFGVTKTHTVHKLITETFLGPCPEGHEVNHKDLIKINNDLNNLEYITPSENQKHSIAHGRKIAYGKDNGHGLAKLTEEQVRHIRKLSKEGVKSTIIAKNYNMTYVSINNILKRKTWFWLED
jgi:hypothetical protein